MGVIAWIVVCVCCQPAIAHVSCLKAPRMCYLVRFPPHRVKPCRIGSALLHGCSQLSCTAPASTHLPPFVHQKKQNRRTSLQNLFPTVGSCRPVTNETARFQNTDGSRGFVFTLENPCSWSPTMVKVLLPPLSVEPWQGLLGWRTGFCTSTALPLIFALVSSHGCRNEEA